MGGYADLICRTKNYELWLNVKCHEDSTWFTIELLKKCKKTKENYLGTEYIMATPKWCREDVDLYGGMKEFDEFIKELEEQRKKEAKGRE